MIRATIFADASYCPHTHASGWAAWVKMDGWHKGVLFGGQFKRVMKSSQEAETAALANAVARLARQGALSDVKEIMLQSDCINALLLVMQAVRRTTVAEHPEGAAITFRLIKPSATEKEAIQIIRTALDLIATVRVRHVRGHQAGDHRQWVNRECDRLAHTHMIANRAVLGVKSGARTRARLTPKLAR